MTQCSRRGARLLERRAAAAARWTVRVSGRVTDVISPRDRGSPGLPIGGLCNIEHRDGHGVVPAEVVGFRKPHPAHAARRRRRHRTISRIVVRARRQYVPVGHAMLDPRPRRPRHARRRRTARGRPPDPAARTRSIARARADPRRPLRNSAMLGDRRHAHLRPRPASQHLRGLLVSAGSPARHDRHAPPAGGCRRADRRALAARCARVRRRPRPGRHARSIVVVATSTNRRWCVWCVSTAIAEFFVTGPRRRC